ncbi:MAG: AAA family ATPase [Clostridiales bacterium]|nr:AAA family ATPase [Clostridiales bacterium]
MNKELTRDRTAGTVEDPFAGLEVPPVFGEPRRGILNPAGEDNGGEKPSEEAPAGLQEEEQQEEAEPEEEEEAESIEDLKAELNGYIGLTVIKEQVESLINWININKKRSDMGLPTPDLSLHMVFSGNPGTGKTMVARLMSRIFKSLGLLSKGHLIEVDRSGLVAGYVGQTAIKTKEICDSAKGGVLFIDEAYALTNRGANDYGQEAVDTVLKCMEDYRDDLVVIVAGYIEPMQEFIHSNPGLESRFNRFMDFPDYTLDEMTDIFDMRCRQGGYSVEEDAKITLRDIISEKSQDVRGFGNARGVRNLFELAIAEQADRLAALPADTELTKELLMTITADDLIKAAEKK